MSRSKLRNQLSAADAGIFTTYRVSGGGAGAFCGAAGTSAGAAEPLVGHAPVAHGEAVPHGLHEVVAPQGLQAAGALQGEVSQADLQLRTRGALQHFTFAGLQHLTRAGLQQRAASAESADATNTMAATASKLKMLRVILLLSISHLSGIASLTSRYPNTCSD